MAENKAAFGVFPQMKPRRSKQDREAAKSFPLDVARGFVAGALGAPADILNIPAAVYSMATGKDMLYEVPYGSEHFQQTLPGKPTTPTGEFAGGLGALAGGFYTGPAAPVRLMAGVPRAAVRAGKDFIMAAPQGAPRMFIGPKAKTWDQAKADRAVQMEKEGKDPVDIWRETGTFRSADGILRQEISDVGAVHRNPTQLKELGKQKKEEAAELQQRLAGIPGQKDMFPKALTEAKKPAREKIKTLKEEADELMRHSDVRGQRAKFALEHPELYKAYPDLGEITVYQGNRGIGGERASIRGGPQDLQMEITQSGLRGDPRSSALHEMQHAIQTIEGMGPGGSPAMAFKNPKAFEILEELRKKALEPMSFDDYAKQYSHVPDLQQGYESYKRAIPRVVKNMDRELQQQAAMEYYKRLAGEAEARATQAREPLTQSQRAAEFPYSSYDVLPEDLIVNPSKSFKEGGSVHISDNADAQMMEMMDKKMAGGGLLKALKGVQKALPQAEREANLQKLLEPSKVKERLYHGTTATEGGKGQEAIRRLKPSKEGALGSGVYMTPKPNYAGEYTSGTGGNILPVHAQIKNPLVLNMEGNYVGETAGSIDPMILALTKLGVEPEKAARMVERAYENKGYIGKEVETRARAQGYDGLMQYRNGELTEVVSYNPNAIKSATGNVGTYDVTSPDLSKAKGGKVSFSDNLDAMMMDVEDRKMAGGGLSKLAKLARAVPKTKQEIEAIAERIAPQVTGEFVREGKGTQSVAGKTQKQFAREKDLPVKFTDIKQGKPVEVINPEKLQGMVVTGIPGDPTITGKSLVSVGDIRLDSPSPQHGGPMYGRYQPEDIFWASGIGPAGGVQRVAKEAMQAYDAPVAGQYIMMGPDSINYAQHFADANLSAIDLSKMSKKQIEEFNKLVRFGDEKSGPRPAFPGIEDKESSYLHLAFDPHLRRHFNRLMQMPTVTERLNLPSGQDIRFAVTEPELRNLETGVTGFSMGRLQPEVPKSALPLSTHPTYSHDIPGQFMGGMKYPTPYELTFPDTLKSVRENPKQAGQEFGSLKMVGPRQIYDQQMIDELKMYEEAMKKLTGKKKGGAVEKPDNGLIKVTKKRKAKA